MDKKWEKVFNSTKTKSNSTLELGREQRVALVLWEGKRSSVDVDDVIVGSSEKMPTFEMMRHEITHFHFARGEDDAPDGGNMTVTNVFLYNRLLSVGELKIVKKTNDKKGKDDGSVRGSVSQLLLLLLGFCAFVALY
ncbi:trans-sialidase [Trypanosoma cruzi]|nr:trans-sialidase [Trypanosoma cruzi]